MITDQDLAPPPGWQPRSPFFKALWAKLAAEQLAAMRLPMAGHMICPHCNHEIAVSLHMDEPIPD